MTDTCVKCGDTLPGGAHFCPGCGVPRSEALPPMPEPPAPEAGTADAEGAPSRAIEEGWDTSSEPEPAPEHHHLHAAEAAHVAKVAAGTTAKTLTWFVGILFTICIICAVFAIGVLVVMTFGGGLIPGIVLGGGLVVALVGFLYWMLRRAGFFTPASEIAAAQAAHAAAASPHAAAAQSHDSPVAHAAKYPLMALGMLAAAVLAVIVIITYYATVVSAVSWLRIPLPVGIVLATLLLAGLGYLLYTRIDFQGMKK